MSRASLLNSQVGEYRLVDFLGAGGMGEVYRAVHTKIGRVVAVKVLTSASAGESFGERFLNEARIQASLHHQNVATLYDFLEFNGQPCIVMEYIDGHSLIDRVRERGLLPLQEALYIFRAVVEAISYVHGQGIIHRDIKSNNIKINAAGEVKLLDFGIAKSGSTPSLTVAGGLVGTLQYLSPEQIKGGGADARSDIWALGALLYEMLTGQPPFQAATIIELCDRIGKGTYTQASSLNQQVTREVEAIIARCLKKRCSDRYQSAQELLRDLSRIIPSAAPPSLKETSDRQPLSTLKKRWPLFAGAGTLVAVIALAFSFLMSSTGNQPGPATNRNARGATGNQSRATVNAPDGSGLKSYQIDTIEGTADVYLDGQKVGSTPYEIKAQAGQKVDLMLKRDGYVDRHEEFTVGENKKVYTFSMQKKQ